MAYPYPQYNAYQQPMQQYQPAQQFQPQQNPQANIIVRPVDYQAGGNLCVWCANGQYSGWQLSELRKILHCNCAEYPG